MLKALRRAAETRASARRLCAGMMEQARDAGFYTRLGVPDTLDGRFDIVALHAWLVLEQAESDAKLAGALVDEIFLQFDEALRDLGTGDAGMNRRLKTLAGMFYGRLSAYRTAESLEELAEAIWRNIYRGSEQRRAEARALARYARQARSHLARPADGIRLDFGPVPHM